MSDEIYKLMLSHLKKISLGSKPRNKQHTVEFQEGRFEILHGWKNYWILNFTDKPTEYNNFEEEDLIEIDINTVNKIDRIIADGYSMLDQYLSKAIKRSRAWIYQMYKNSKTDMLEAIDDLEKDVENIKKEILEKDLSIYLYRDKGSLDSDSSSSSEREDYAIYMSRLDSDSRGYALTVYHETLHSLHQRYANSKIFIEEELYNKGRGKPYSGMKKQITLTPPSSMIEFFSFYTYNICGYTITQGKNISSKNLSILASVFQNEYLCRIKDLSFRLAVRMYMSELPALMKSKEFLEYSKEKFDNDPKYRDLKLGTDRIIDIIYQNGMDSIDMYYRLKAIDEDFGYSFEISRIIFVLEQSQNYNLYPIEDIKNAVFFMNKQSEKYLAGSTLMQFCISGDGQNIVHMTDSAHKELISSYMRNLISFLMRGTKNPTVDDICSLVSDFLNMKLPKALYLKLDTMRIVAGLYDRRNSEETIRDISEDIYYSMFSNWKMEEEDKEE